MTTPEPVVTAFGPLVLTRCQVDGHAWAAAVWLGDVVVCLVCTRPGCMETATTRAGGDDSRAHARVV